MANVIPLKALEKLNNTNDLEQDTQPISTKEPDKDGKVLVDKITLDNILDRLNTIEGKKITKTAELRNRKCRVRFVEEGDNYCKLVVGYGKTWEAKEIDGSKVLKIEVLTEDNKKHVVNYVEFNENGKQEEAEILDMKKEEIIENLGYTTVKKVDYDNYTTIDTGREVPVQVTSNKYTYKLRLLKSNRVVTLDDSAIN
jgi:hypothetical protein